MTDSEFHSGSRRSGGCLRGCLGAILLFAIVVGGLVFYSGWTIYHGLKNDHAVEIALSTVRANPTAVSVLGGDIAIEQVEGETFTSVTGSGKTVSYVMKLRGNRAEGQLHVIFHSQAREEMKIVSMILTGPDEERYNLISPRPPAGSI